MEQIHRPVRELAERDRADDRGGARLVEAAEAVVAAPEEADARGRERERGFRSEEAEARDHGPEKIDTGGARRPLAPAAIFAAALLAACGSNGATPLAGDAGAPARDASFDAPSPPLDASPDAAIAEAGASADDAALLPTIDAGALVLPRVLDFDGGVLASAHLVAVTFPGDPQSPQIDAFTSAIGASAYWSQVTSEYGVGPATGAAIAETESAPGTVNQGSGDSETWLASRFDGTHPEWGAFDPSAVYVVFYPSTTTAVPSVGGCGGAYHAWLPITIPAADEGGAPTNATMIYAIVFRCATSPDVGRPAGFDLTTFMASHEMIEASTDPFGTAFAETDDAHVAWAYFFGSEIGDMCAFHAGAAIKPAALGYTVQRVWSNAAAASLLDPCVPGASDPFFVAAPTDEKAIALPGPGGTSFASQGYDLPAGSSITVRVGFYGSAPGAWTVTPFTYAMEHGAAEPYLEFSPATLTGAPGDVLPLTIHRLAEDDDGNGGDAVKLVSTLGGMTNESYFAVTN